MFTDRNHSSSKSSHLSESDKEEVRIENVSEDDISPVFEGVTEEDEPFREDKDVSHSLDVSVTSLFNSLFSSLKNVSVSVCKYTCR